MTPGRITRAYVGEAVRLIISDGVPPRGSGCGYCLVTSSEHLRPKQTISVAHQVATDELPSPDQFSGDSE